MNEEEIKKMETENDFLKWMLDQIRNNTGNVDLLTRDQMHFKLKTIHNMILALKDVKL